MPASTVVTVPATMLWVEPTSPRDLDGPAVVAHPDVVAWLAGLDAVEDGRLGLHGRVETQLVLGEPVQVIGTREDWCQVICPWQPSSADPRGYPGWVPAAHLGDAGTVDSPTPAAQARVTGPALLAEARRHLGLAYLWGGMSFHGVDCSGLTSRVYAANGIALRRDADIQFTDPRARAVERDALQPGDLLFFGEKRITHVGIYVGGQRFLSATTYQTPVVREDTLDDPHWAALYRGARRMPGTTSH